MPRSPKARTPELSGLELSVMRVVWKAGSATASEVRAGLVRDYADTTIHTVLSNLQKKGYIAPVPTIERARRYRPSVPREAVVKRSLKKMVKDLFDGSTAAAMLHMLRHEKLDEDELEELRRLLDEKREQ